MEGREPSSSTGTLIESSGMRGADALLDVVVGRAGKGLSVDD